MRNVHYILALATLAACETKPQPEPSRTPDAARQATLPDGLRSVVSAPALSSAPPQGALRYDIPDGCKLQYEVDGGFHMNPMTEQGVQGEGPRMVVSQQFEMYRGGPADFEITWGDSTIADAAGSAERAPTAPAGSLAKTWLEVSGDRVDEVQGPTAAWSAYGTFPGPVVFFPALPGGSEVAWAPAVHAHGSGLAVEAVRGSATLPEGQPAPPTRRVPHEGTARLVEWVSIQGTPAAVITANWTANEATAAEDPTHGEVTSNQNAEHRGEYLVTADGRLLAGWVDGRAHLQIAASGQAPALKLEVNVQGTIRLVQSCAEGDITIGAQQ